MNKQQIRTNAILEDVRYEIRGEPLVTQACHWRDSQRTTGSAFVIHIVVNLVERHLQLLEGLVYQIVKFGLCHCRAHSKTVN